VVKDEISFLPFCNLLLGSAREEISDGNRGFYEMWERKCTFMKWGLDILFLEFLLPYRLDVVVVLEVAVA
jgi:hypothetical protein